MDKLLAFVSAQCTPVVDVPDTVQARMVITLCEKLLRDMRQEVFASPVLDKIMLFCLVWGIGGRLDQVRPKGFAHACLGIVWYTQTRRK